MNKLTFFISVILFSTNIWSQNSLIDTNNNFSSNEFVVIDEASFNNIIAKPKEEGFNLSWGINYEVYDAFVGKNLIIKYNTKIGSKRNKKGFEGSEWKYTEPFNVSKTNFDIKDLQGDENTKLIWE